MNKSPAAISSACLFLAFISLVFGFWEVGRYAGVTVLVIFAIFWYVSCRLPLQWLSIARLVGFTAISVWGLLNAVSPFLTIAGITFALAGWEIEDPPPNRSPSPGIGLYESLHLKLIGYSSVIGLILGSVCLTIQLNLPFEILFVIILVFIFSFYLFFTILRKNDHLNA